MSKENEKTTDDGQPTTDATGFNNEKPVNNEDTSSTIPAAHTGQTSYITDHTSYIKEMEVHKHPHHITHKKKWGEYLLEFLMLFLAVFLGFMAESYREHQIERKREKEYMKEIVQNLEYDTLRCSLNILTNDQIFSGLDSLRTELKKAVHGIINANAIYYFSLQYAGNSGRAVFNTSAITELKNSGSLRLIENKELVNALADYYERKIIAAESYLPTGLQVSALQKTQNEIVSLVDLDHYINSYDHFVDKNYAPNYDYRDILEHVPALQLLRSDAVSLEKYYTELARFEIQLKNYNFWLGFDKKAAKELITEIKKEYHLE